MIGKRAKSVYEPGARSGAWIKIKLLHEQEFVIGGYTEPEGTRKFFGSLIVGFYRRKELVFVGRVGTDFSTALLEALFQAQANRTTFVSFCKFAPSAWKQMGSGDYRVRDEVLPLGGTSFGMSGQVQRTDTRRASAPTRFSWTPWR